MNNLHPEKRGVDKYKNKDKIYFCTTKQSFKKMRLDAAGEFFRRDCKIVEASRVVALKIAKQKNPAHDCRNINQVLCFKNG